MRFLFSFCVVTAVLMVCAPAWADEARFASVMDDLPLMSELVEIGEGVEFSTSAGRIAEITAEGKVSRADVLAFYGATLPQLGWARVGESTFVREEESLNLVLEENPAGLRVRFALTPLKK